MNLTQEKALFHLTGTLELSRLSKEALQQLCDESPWFAPAHFFLTAQSKSKEEEWIERAQHTNLYFTNPGWLQFQLQDISAEPFPAADKKPETANAATHTLEAFRETMRKIGVAEEPEETGSEQAMEEIETEAADNKISGLLSSQLADFKKPVEATDVLEIDSDKRKLHTIDYFASQGIKIDLSAIPQDKLTTHLRKFTDWLKTVKTTHTVAQEFVSNPEMEKAVAETAESSNETREIVTEAMADVLVKQGQTEKAIQLYIKLSFLNPEKSSYFAAKIEQLKGI